MRKRVSTNEVRARLIDVNTRKRDPSRWKDPNHLLLALTNTAITKELREEVREKGVTIEQTAVIQAPLGFIDEPEPNYSSNELKQIIDILKRRLKGKGFGLTQQMIQDSRKSHVEFQNRGAGLKKPDHILQYKGKTLGTVDYIISPERYQKIFDILDELEEHLRLEAAQTEKEKASEEAALELSKRKKHLEGVVNRLEQQIADEKERLSAHEEKRSEIESGDDASIIDTASAGLADELSKNRAGLERQKQVILETLGVGEIKGITEGTYKQSIKLAQKSSSVENFKIAFEALFKHRVKETDEGRKKPPHAEILFRHLQSVIRRKETIQRLQEKIDKIPRNVESSRQKQLAAHDLHTNQIKGRIKTWENQLKDVTKRLKQLSRE